MFPYQVGLLRHGVKLWHRGDRLHREVASIHAPAPVDWYATLGGVILGMEGEVEGSLMEAHVHSS